MCRFRTGVYVEAAASQIQIKVGQTVSVCVRTWEDKFLSPAGRLLANAHVKQRCKFGSCSNWADRAVSLTRHVRAQVAGPRDWARLRLRWSQGPSLPWGLLLRQSSQEKAAVRTSLLQSASPGASCYLQRVASPAPAAGDSGARDSG